MVELRKRKAPAPPPVTEKKSKPGPKPKATKKTDTVVPEEDKKDAPKGDAPKASTVPEVGDVLDLATFGGDFETNEGTATSLKKLVDESKAGVVIFTYPKASTPGCMFRPNLPRSQQLAFPQCSFTHLDEL